MQKNAGMKIKFSKKFSKQYGKSPKQIRRFFDERLALFIKDQSDPLLNNHSLKGNLSGYRSINITGDWRALYSEYEENDSGTIVIFELIGTHSQLYR